MAKIDLKITPKNAPNSTGFDATCEGEFPGGEPEAYIKEIAISGEKLIVTKKDNTVVEYSPTSNIMIEFNNDLFTFDGEEHDATPEILAEFAKIKKETCFLNDSGIATKMFDENGLCFAVKYGYYAGEEGADFYTIELVNDNKYIANSYNI